jgi:hypothetical protein
MEGAMMRRFAFACCTAILVLGCAKSDDAATADTAAGTVGATATPAPTIALADVAGRWNLRSVPETGDTTPIMSQINATASTSGWTMTLPNRPPVASRVIVVAGDSIVTETGPFESVMRRGVQVTTRTTMRLRDGRLVGSTRARYSTTGPDSVLLLRVEGTRAP